MYTKEFIEKVSKAKEIQKLCKYEKGDYIYSEEDNRMYLIYHHTLSNRILIFYEDINNGMHSWDHDEAIKTKFKWLPTLEQLFGIWCSLCETTNFAGLCQRIINRKSKLVTYPNIKFVKLLCLEAIMKEFYNKQWNGKGWDVIE
jgi:hypothetical protein